MTNKVNETYAKSYDMDFTLEDTEKLLDKDNDSLALLPTVTKQMILKTIIHLLLSPTLSTT